MIDLGAMASFAIDAKINGNQRSGVKAVFSFVSIVTDILLDASVAVKPALYGSQYYLKATGRYVSTAVGTAAAAKPILIGIGRDEVFDAVSDRVPRR